jgi:protein CWC15
VVIIAIGGRNIRDTASHPIQQYSNRDLPGHTELKTRRPGQSTEDEVRRRNLREDLRKAEKEHFAKVKEERRKKGIVDRDVEDEWETESRENTIKSIDMDQELSAKKQKILEKAKELDADESSEDESESSDDRFVSALGTSSKTGLLMYVLN